MSQNRDITLLHPFLYRRLQPILKEIQDRLPSSHSCKPVSIHRTPQEQFELFKKGRKFVNGSWVKDGSGSTVTNIDGFTKLSNHNYLPCHAFDTGIFNGTTYLGNSPLYKNVKFGAKKFNLEWGGNWVSIIDQPHIEIPKEMLFKGNRTLDTALQWQLYLVKAGTYTGVLDGMFGQKSADALFTATGEQTRNVTSWKKLVAKFGPL